MSDCVTPQTAAHQAPLSLGFSRQEHWSGLPCPSPIRESEVAQSCPTLSDPMDGSLRGSPVPGILQGRALEWVPSPPPNCECSHLHILQIYVWFIFRWLLECIVCWSVSEMINKLSLYSLFCIRYEVRIQNYLFLNVWPVFLMPLIKVSFPHKCEMPFLY